ncbi:MAG: hypothetical protein ABL921_25920 [Pirellula sp.]
MKIRVSTWMFYCVLSGAVFGICVKPWNPDPAKFLSEPVWVFPDAHPDVVKTTFKALHGPAPEIISDISIRDLVGILEDHCPATFLESELADESISPDERFPNFMRKRSQSLETWLSASLKELSLTFAIQHGSIHICPQTEVMNITRIYPHPVVAGFGLLSDIETHINPSMWQSAGGVCTLSTIDTQTQTLLVVSTDYSTHRKLEQFLKPIYQNAGIGWRTDAERWTQLPRAVLNRLTKWIDPDSLPQPTNNSKYPYFGTNGTPIQSGPCGGFF